MKNGKTIVSEILENVENELYANVRSYVANKGMVWVYWNIGHEIVEKQGGVK